MRGLIHRCDIFRADEASKQTDPWNQETDALFVEVASNQKCRFVWPIGRENQERFDDLQQRTMIADAALFLPIDVDVRVDDQIRNVTERGNVIAAEDFNVLRVLPRSGRARSHQRVEVKAIQSTKVQVG